MGASGSVTSGSGCGLGDPRDQGRHQDAAGAGTGAAQPEPRGDLDHCRAASAVSPAARIARQRRRRAGEDLELVRRLVHEQVQAGHQHPVGGRGRQRSGPRVVEHLEDDGHVGAARDEVGHWASAGMVLTSTSPLGDSVSAASRPGRSGRRSAARSPPRSPQHARANATSRVTSPAPASHSARPVDAAVAPAPRIVAALSDPSQRSRRAARAPGRSVLSACDVPVDQEQGVGGADQTRPAR